MVAGDTAFGCDGPLSRTGVGTGQQLRAIARPGAQRRVFRSQRVCINLSAAPFELTNQGGIYITTAYRPRNTQQIRPTDIRHARHLPREGHLATLPPLHDHHGLRTRGHPGRQAVPHMLAVGSE